MFFNRSKAQMISADQALPGRDESPFHVPTHNVVLNTPMQPPFPEGHEVAILALGCFWGAERLFWQLDGVYTTAAGYAGGYTPYPTYEEVCSGRTGHAEVILAVYDPEKVGFEDLLRVFFEAHDPTQGMRQGNDVGTQYRSAIYYTSDKQKQVAQTMRDAYNAELRKAGRNEITTEIAQAGPFYYAEDYHQQYLQKVPNGYCGLAGTGVTCPMPEVQASNGNDPYLKPVPATEDEWKAVLSPDEYRVLRQAGTERPFFNEYVDTESDGEYRCRACGNLLFSSETKYHSGCGWPSFTEAIPGSVIYNEDRSHGMRRTEVRCARCESHLGHVFDDGPREAGGQRYCMNSIAMTLQEK
jgi:peptide-methionine (S)-S-oxide reductase